MAEIIRFGAMHYNVEKLEELTDVVCPPYDVINDEYREELIERSPYNYVNLTLPEGEGDEKYRGAMNRIFNWLLRDVLKIDTETCYYLYEQIFNFEGEEMKRTGLIGLLKVEEYGGSVKPHERTFSRYVEDRFNLLSETKTEMEGIMLLYDDPQKALQVRLENYVEANEPMLSVKGDDGNEHRIYQVKDDEVSAAIKEFASKGNVYIADGHHRYETARQYREKMSAELGDKYKGNEPFNYMMAAFFNAHDDGIKIFPTHRLVTMPTINGMELLKKLEDKYKIAVMEFSDYRMEKAARIKLRRLLNEYKSQGKKVFGLYMKPIPNKYFVLTLKDDVDSVVNRPVSQDLKGLDVLILESSILSPILNIDPNGAEKQVEYIRGDSKALDMVKTGKCQIAFILNSVDPVQVVRVADNAEEMPHKSTDFYPKLMSGLLSYSLRYSKIKQ